MVPGYRIELIGGPLDGQQHVIAEDLTVVRFAAWKDPAKQWSGKADDVPTTEDLTTIEYLLTAYVTKDNARVYMYVVPHR
jgi:hypothetical protein